MVAGKRAPAVLSLRACALRREQCSKVVSTSPKGCFDDEVDSCSSAAL
jgi:hypothetical protein